MERLKQRAVTDYEGRLLQLPLIYREQLKEVLMLDIPTEITVKKRVIEDGTLRSECWEAEVQGKGYIRSASTPAEALGMVVTDFGEELGLKISIERREKDAE